MDDIVVPVVGGELVVVVVVMGMVKSLFCAKPNFCVELWLSWDCDKINQFL